MARFSISEVFKETLRLIETLQPSPDETRKVGKALVHRKNTHVS
jgi:hypothetical protein